MSVPAMALDKAQSLVTMLPAFGEDSSVFKVSRSLSGESKYLTVNSLTFSFSKAMTRAFLAFSIRLGDVPCLGSTTLKSWEKSERRGV